MINLLCSVWLLLVACYFGVQPVAKPQPVKSIARCWGLAGEFGRTRLAVRVQVAILR